MVAGRIDVIVDQLAGDGGSRFALLRMRELVAHDARIASRSRAVSGTARWYRGRRAIVDAMEARTWTCLASIAIAVSASWLVARHETRPLEQRIATLEHQRTELAAEVRDAKALVQQQNAYIDAVEKDVNDVSSRLVTVETAVGSLRLRMDIVQHVQGR